MSFSLHLTPEDRDLGHRVHGRFAPLPEARYLASEAALAWLAALLRTLQPRVVVELGPGIGTITELLLTHPSPVARVISVESEPRFVEHLKANLTRSSDPRLSVVTSLAEFESMAIAADLLVADGGFYSQQETNALVPGSIVFAEGVRQKWRDMVSGALCARGLHVDFEPFGQSKAGLVPSKTQILGVPIPILRRRSAGGCWIGIVRSAAEPAY